MEMTQIDRKYRFDSEGESGKEVSCKRTIGQISPYLAQWVHLPLLLSVKKRIMVLHRDKWSEPVVQCIVCSECKEKMVG